MCDIIKETIIKKSISQFVRGLRLIEADIISDMRSDVDVN